MADVTVEADNHRSTTCISAHCAHKHDKNNHVFDRFSLIVTPASPSRMRMMGGPHIVSTHLDGRVLLAAGDSVPPEAMRVTAPIRDGLRVLVILDGAMTLTAADEVTIEVDAPTSIAVFSNGETRRDQHFREGRPFRYVLVQVDRNLVLAELGLDPEALLRASSGRQEAGNLVINARHASAACGAVASQILACPETRAYDLYRLSKALELTALVLGDLAVETASDRPLRLTAAEFERIREAHDQLLASLNTPPTPAELALKVGINLNKLNRGFRALFGATPHGVLQEHRLQAAFRMLSSGQVSVSQAASAIGYTQTHFATLFRKRFGCPPSALLPRNNNAGPADAPSNGSNKSRM